jgi:hypothetical protein
VSEEQEPWRLGGSPEEGEEERAPLCIEEESLNWVGVRMVFESDWIGDPPDRHAVPNPNLVRSVFLPFTPDDWWELTTRDGDDYIGPCCGTTGAMQDILNSVYRDGGWIDGHELLELGSLAENHEDGFENWGEPLEGDAVIRTLASWMTLDRWGRIGVVYRVLRKKLSPKKQSLTVRSRGLPEKDAIPVLRNGMTFLSYEDVFRRNKDEDGQQNHANRILLIARILPAMRTIFDSFKNYQPFEGFALVYKETPDAVLDNRLGACVYKTSDDAQKVLDSSRDISNMEGEDLPSILIRPVRITVEEGLTFTDGTWA